MRLVNLPPSFTNSIATFKKHGIPFEATATVFGDANGLDGDDVAIREQSGEFRLVDIEQACPGVGREWIRSLLTDLKAAGEATCQGKGPAARWRYFGSKGSNS